MKKVITIIIAVSCLIGCENTTIHKIEYRVDCGKCDITFRGQKTLTDISGPWTYSYSATSGSSSFIQADYLSSKYDFKAHRITVTILDGDKIIVQKSDSGYVAKAFALYNIPE